MFGFWKYLDKCQRISAIFSILVMLITIIITIIILLVVSPKTETTTITTEDTIRSTTTATASESESTTSETATTSESESESTTTETPTTSESESESTTTETATTTSSESESTTTESATATASESTTTETMTTTDLVEKFLYLSDTTILSLPSFENFPCQIELPNTFAYGVAGEVTDKDGIKRLMVCSKVEFGCYLRMETAWEPENTMGTNRLLAASSSDGSSGWLVTGGADESNHYQSSTEVFKDGSWMAGPELPGYLYNHCQVEVGGKVIIAGGRQDDASAKTFVLDENVWTEVGNLIQARQFHACAELSGKVYSIGGKTGDGTLLDSVEIYDPATKIWVEGPQLPSKSATAQAINFQNTIYVLGGETGDGSAANTQIFKMTENGSAWETINEGVDEHIRSIFPAQVVTSDLLNCQ